MKFGEVIDEIRSIGSGFLERIRNPFGVTLIISFCLLHWRLIFALFNFDSSFNLNEKIRYISNYLSCQTSGDLIWKPILAAFIATLAYLILQILFLAIYTFFQKWGKPSVFWIVDKNKLADRATVETLRKTATNYQKKYEKTYSQLVTVKTEISELNDKLITSEDERNKLNNEFNSFKTERILFIDNFEVDHGWWNFFKDTTIKNVEIGNRSLIILPGLDSKDQKKEIGVFVNLISGVHNKETYEISIKAWSNDRIPFKISVSDYKGGKGAGTDQLIPEQNEQEFKMQFVANETNAMNVMISCNPGHGKLYVTRVIVRRVK